MVKRREGTSVEVLTLEDFVIDKVIGRGAFGKVFLATFGDKKYAIKSIRKDILLEYDQVDGVMLEK